jgi:hypothetical protein
MAIAKYTIYIDGARLSYGTSYQPKKANTIQKDDTFDGMLKTKSPYSDWTVSINRVQSDDPAVERVLEEKLDKSGFSIVVIKTVGDVIVFRDTWVGCDNVDWSEDHGPNKNATISLSFEANNRIRQST